MVPRDPDDLFLALLAEAHEDVVAREETHDEQPLQASRETDAELAERLADAAECLRLLERARRSGEPSARQRTAQHPEKIGRFQIKRLLGEGSYGVVYLAVDPKLDRRVALKIPRCEVVISPALHARFIHEAGTSARFEHDNLVRVYEAGRADGFDYIASEYCAGPTLDCWLKQRREPLAPKDAASLAAVLADAVAHAHSRGVLHRDLKPSNVLLAGSTAAPSTAIPDGSAANHGAPGVDLAGTSDVRKLQPKVADFGLAKVEGEDHGRTATNAIVGTPAYMAPEQAAGDAAAVGTAADVYSLGAILFQLLTGRPPFEAPTVMATLEAVRRREAAPPSRLRTGVPPDLDAICLKCLAKTPAARYRSAADLADDLRRFVGGHPVTARRITAAERLIRWSCLNPLLSGLAASIALLALVIVVGSIVAAVLLARANKKANEFLVEARANERRSLHSSFAARTAEAKASRKTKRPGQSFQALAAIDQAVGDATELDILEEHRLRLRNEAIAAMVVVDVQPDAQWLDDQPRSSQSSWIGFDAAVERYAGLETGGEIVIRRLADNAELRRLPGLSQASKPLVQGGNPKPLVRFLPCGELLVVRGIDQRELPRVQLWKLQPPSDAPLLDEPAGGGWQFKNMDFSADGHRLVFAGPDDTLVVCDLASTGQIVSRTQFKLGWTPRWLRCSPDGQLAAISADGGGSVSVFDLSRQAEIRRLQNGYRADAAAWTPDGERLATCANSNLVTVWDPRTGRQQLRVETPASVFDVAFDPQGEWLLTCGYYHSWIWDARDGGLLLELDGAAIQFSADRSWIGYGRDGLVVGRWRLTPRRELAILSGNDGGLIQGLNFHPEGRLLASVGNVVRLWDSASGKQAAELPFAGMTAMFERDGSTLGVGEPIGGNCGFWPVNFQVEAGVWRFGPPRLSNQFPSYTHRLRIGRDDLPRLAQLATSKWPVITKDGMSEVAYAVSPSGASLVTSPESAKYANVWDTRTGELAATIHTAGPVLSVAFSPDGNLMVLAGSQEYATYDVGTWQLRDRIRKEWGVNAMAVFSRDRRVLAATFPRNVKLFDAASGRELATLSTPRQVVPRLIAMSLDGCRLAVATDSNRIYLWQLDRLRDRLADMKLDWQSPPLRREMTRERGFEVRVLTDPRHVEVWNRRRTIGMLTGRLNRDPADVEALWQRAREHFAMGSLDATVADGTRALELKADCHHAFFWRGRAHMVAERYAEAAADLEASLTILPDDDWCLRHAAWVYVGGPPELRDTGRAHQLAQRAVDLARQRKRSSEPLCVAVLGMVQFRLGEYETALATLDEAAKAGLDNSRILLFKAMCLQELGNHETARETFQRALARIDATASDGHGDPALVLRETAQKLRLDESVESKNSTERKDL